MVHLEGLAQRLVCGSGPITHSLLYAYHIARAYCAGENTQAQTSQTLHACSHTHQTFTEHLLCDRHCANHWEHRRGQSHAWLVSAHKMGHNGHNHTEKSTVVTAESTGQVTVF